MPTLDWLLKFALPVFTAAASAVAVGGIAYLAGIPRRVRDLEELIHLVQKDVAWIKKTHGGRRG